MIESDRVVLLDDEGRPIGSAPKSTVHDVDTALHLAFSCHVLNDRGELLVTRRALAKRTWPGVWTNSFCGHPRPGEAIADAVHRRAEEELGLVLHDLEVRLPGFRYRATDPGGVVEHELCPVYVARAGSLVRPHPAEVAEFRWVDPADLAVALSAAPWAFSPWLVLQADELDLFRVGRAA
jgi:isopentenyl-diphosphate Delta-isomerase